MEDYIKTVPRNCSKNEIISSFHRITWVYYEKVNVKIKYENRSAFPVSEENLC